MEREQFHLDTLDHCFLCLKTVSNGSVDNPNSGASSGSSNGNESIIVLNQNQSDIISNKDKLEVTNFDKLVQYLGIDFNQVMNEVLPPDFQVDHSGGRHVSGNFCTACSKHTVKFNELHQKLELIKLQMLDILWNIYATMEEGYGDDMRNRQFSDDMNRCLATKMCRPFLQRLWNYIKDNCERLLSKEESKCNISRAETQECLFSTNNSAAETALPPTPTDNQPHSLLFTSTSTSIMAPNPPNIQEEMDTNDNPNISALSKDDDIREIDAPSSNEVVAPTAKRKHVCLLCPCPQRFRLLRHLKAHQTRVHQGNQFKCQFCPKAFPKLRNLNVHNALVHVKRQNEDDEPTEEKERQCDICSKILATKLKMERHRRQHSKKQLYFPITTDPPSASSSSSASILPVSTPSPSEEQDRLIYSLIQMDVEPSVHLPLKNNLCVHCNRHFANRQAILMHIRWRHPETLLNVAVNQ